MKQIYDITEEIKGKLLDFLYQDEVMNVFLIHYLENCPEDLDKLFIGNTEDKITEILHIKNDGNSFFTSFYAESTAGLDKISEHVRNIYQEGILLAGKIEDIEHIQRNLGIYKESSLYNYLKFNVNKVQDLKCNDVIAFRRATDENRDIAKLKQYLIEFFEVEEQEDIERIISDHKIEEELRNGIYFLEVNNEIAGMARYFGQSSRYIDITTVYIDKLHRSKGYGRLLMQHMINEALKNDKIPITQVSISNDRARQIYEDLGFEKVCDYTFQFI